MTRVAVIGNAGGGKSTMCRKLSAALGLPLYPIDTLQWKPGWVPTPAEEFTRRHDNLIKHDRWIIDGWGTHEAILARFAAADTIILVDHPLYIHYWWAIKRQIKTLFRPRPDGPEGCPMLPMTWQLCKMIWRIHKDARPHLIQVVEALRPQKRVIHIRSPRQLQQFIREYCQPA
jgi:adenylate kinase family enzyme